MPRPIASLLRRWLLSLVPLLSSAFAGETSYLMRDWDFETGMSMGGLNCLQLGRDGFLWLGAKDGLVRFDGVQFNRVKIPDSDLLQGNSITALWESEQGELWLGCESGEVFRWDRRQGVVTALPQKWSAQPVRSIARDGHNEVWLALATHDLVRVSDGWTLHAPPSAPISGMVQHLLLTTDGRLYQQLGDVIRLEGGTQEAPVWQELRIPDTLIQRIAPSRQGGQWIFADDRIRLWTNKGWGEERTRLPPGSHINRMIESSTGDLFVGTMNQGLVVYHADGTSQELNRDVYARERILDMTEDHEGNLLACSSRRLILIRPKRIDVVPSENNWGGSRPVSVANAADGTWWLGTEGAGLYHIVGTRTEHLTEASGLWNPFVWSLLPERDGTLWVGTWGGGLFKGRDGRFAQAQDWDLAVQGWAVSAILRDHGGLLWVGTNTGLWQWSGDAWRMINDDHGAPVMLVRGIEEDRDGRIWLATNGHGLKYWDQGHVRSVGGAEGLRARFISAVHGDKRGNLWVGTIGMGLYRLDGGRWSHVDHLNGLPVDDIFHIAEDQKGKFWFTSSVGVFSVTRQELVDASSGLLPQVHPLVLDRDDGLPSSYCSRGTQSAACMNSDGRFLVPTALGLAVIPTDRIAPRTDRAPVTITAASVDDREVAVSAEHSVRAPPGTRRIAVEFTAPSFGNPERIHFRYQLLGLDTHWVDLGTRRNVLFNHLPPGDYILRIMASNPDRVWNPIPATLMLTIEPHFWETEWFRIGILMLIVLLVGLTVWYIVHRRARLKLEQLEAQHAIEQERRRIARDIHDDLGASLTQIMMMSQTEAAASGERDNLLPRIHAVACDITKSMDELVWAVNPSHDTLESFAAYGVRIAQELVTAAGLRLRLNLPDQLPDVRLNAGLRHHLLLFLKEAINNVLRHAGASEVSITMTLEHALLRLEVSDNGRGFVPRAVPEEPPAGRPGGHGLPNLRRRAEETGATLEIVSVPGQGTTVRLLVPLPIATPDPVF